MCHTKQYDMFDGQECQCDDGYCSRVKNEDWIEKIEEKEEDVKKEIQLEKSAIALDMFEEVMVN